MSKKPTVDDIGFCDCAECGTELLGDSEANLVLADEILAWKHGRRRPPVVVARVNGQPYCRRCFIPKRPPTTGGRGRADDINPWQENAIREMEDAECP